MRFFKCLVFIFSGILGWYCAHPQLAYSAGSYVIKLKKSESGTTTVKLPANEVHAEVKTTPQPTPTVSAGNTSTANAKTTHIPAAPSRTKMQFAPKAHAAPQPPASASGGSSSSMDMFALLAQVLGYFGNWGGYCAMDVTRFPLSTTLASNGVEWFNDHPVFPILELGVLLNIPVLDILDLEANIGVGGSQFKRRKEQNGYFFEELHRFSTVRYGARLLFPIASPLCAHLGAGGEILRSELAVDTDLPVFEYQGFVLDNATAWEFYGGLDLFSSRQNTLRFRLALEGFYRFADYGSLYGGRLQFAIMGSKFGQVAPSSPALPAGASISSIQEDADGNPLPPAPNPAGVPSSEMEKQLEGVLGN